MLVAITRRPGSELAACELEFLTREPIDVDRAVLQHKTYETILESLGVTLIPLPSDPHYPDGVFVEDPAVIVEEVAVITRLGKASRRGETQALESILAPLRQLRWITAPATLEGGDVLQIGRTLYVGQSTRTNAAGIAQLAAILQPFGYTIRPVRVTGCLHLKTACTYLGADTVIANRAWFDAGALTGLTILDAVEPFAANTLRVADTILISSAFPRTADQLDQAGHRVLTLDISELQKAEAGMTCLSLLLNLMDPVSQT